MIKNLYDPSLSGSETRASGGVLAVGTVRCKDDPVGFPGSQ